MSLQIKNFKELKYRIEKHRLTRMWRNKSGYIFDRWYLDQQVPLQSILRTQCEYDLKFYAGHEFYDPPIDQDHPVQKFPSLRLAYTPQVVPQPYTFEIENAIIYARDIMDPANKPRVFLETFPEVTMIEEGANFRVPLRNYARMRFRDRHPNIDYTDGFLLSGPWWNNYFHFLIDYMMRFSELMDEGLIGDGTKLFVQSNPLGYMKFYFDLLDIEEERIVHSGISPFRVEKMLIGSQRRHRFVISKLALDRFRNKIFGQLGIKLGCGGRRIYISRKSVKHRRLVNEEVVENILSQKGFEIIQPQLLSASDQIKLFSEAECIVTPHGAGLTNLIYSAAPKVIEFFPGDQFEFGYFQSLTSQLGGQHYPIVGTEINWKSDFEIAIDDLHRALEWHGY